MLFAPRSILVVAAGLLGVLASLAQPNLATADEGQDQYAVAAGHYAAKRWRLAADEFQTLLERFPQHPRTAAAQFYRGEALIQSGDYRGGRESLRGYVQAQPNSPQAKHAQFRIGEASYLLNDLAAAKQELEGFLQKYQADRLHAHILPYLGEIALGEERFADAAARFQDVLTRFPDGPLNEDAKFGLARAMAAQDQHDQAETALKELAAAPQGRLADAAQYQLAAMRLDAGKHEAALAATQEFAQKFPNSRLAAVATLVRGSALFHLKRYGEAKKAFDDIAANPQVGPEAKYWLGLCAYAAEDWAQAAAVLTAAADQSPREEFAAAARFHAGDALRRAGDAAGAAKQFEALLATAPQDAWADDALVGKLQLAEAASDHAAVDRLAAEFTRQFAASKLAPQVARLQARSLTARKEYAKAGELLKPLTAAPEALVDRYAMALTLQGQGQHAEALALLPAEAPADADAALRRDVSLARAASLVALNRAEEAIPLLDAALATKPPAATAAATLAQLVVCHAQARQFDRATQRLEQIRREHPGPVAHETTQRLAQLLLAAGQGERAVALYGALTQAGTPGTFVAEGLFGQAWAQQQQKALSAALVTLERLVREFPEHPLAAEAELLRGRIYEQQERYEQALGAYHVVIRTHPGATQAPRAKLRCAVIYDKLRRPEESLALYQELVEKHANFPQLDLVRYRWAWSLHDQGKTKEAEELFQALRRDAPQSPYAVDAGYRLAQAAQAAGDFDRAEALADALLKDPADAQRDADVLAHALYLKGEAAAGKQRWPDVKTVMQQVVERHPQHALRPLAEYWLAEVAYRTGDLAAAEQQFNALAEQAKDRKENWAALVALRQAQLLVQRERYPEARQLAATIGQKWPNFDQQFEVDYVLGRCLAGQGLLDDARKTYRRVIESPAGAKTETAAKAQWMIGETFFHQENYRAALKEFLRVDILYDYPQWQASALWEAGKCHEKLNEPGEAAGLYQQMLKKFPAGPHTVEAEKRLESLMKSEE